MITQKVAVVTGANRGIGKEIAKELSQNGVKVILTASDPEKGEKVVEEFKRNGLDVFFHTLDVTSEESRKSIASFIEKEFGKLDILVNNAALGGGENSLQVSIADFRTTFESNFFGPFRLSQLMIPLLCKSDSGRIVNISSGMCAFNRLAGGDRASLVS